MRGSVADRYRRSGRCPILQVGGDIQRQVDAAVTHAQPETVVPECAMERLGLVVDEHDVGNVLDEVLIAAGGIFADRGDGRHVLFDVRHANPKLLNLGAIGFDAGADGRLEDDSLTLARRKGLFNQADLDPFPDRYVRRVDTITEWPVSGTYTRVLVCPNSGGTMASRSPVFPQ